MISILPAPGDQMILKRCQSFCPVNFWSSVWNVSDLSFFTLLSKSINMRIPKHLYFQSFSGRRNALFERNEGVPIFLAMTVYMVVHKQAYPDRCSVKAFSNSYKWSPYVFHFIVLWRKRAERLKDKRKQNRAKRAECNKDTGNLTEHRRPQAKTRLQTSAYIGSPDSSVSFLSFWSEREETYRILRT